MRPSPQTSALATSPAHAAPTPLDRKPAPSATVAARRATRNTPVQTTAKVVLPVRYSAWINGDMGRALTRTLEDSLSEFEGLRISYLPRAFLIEGREEPGPFLEAVYRAARHMEQRVESTYPVFHHQMGPVWTGTLQSVFT